MKHLQKKVQEILDQDVATGAVSGENVLIRRNDDELIYAEAGYVNIELEKKIERNSIFRLYSMSKPVTSAAVMMLLERGVLDLNAPVSEYLPGFRDLKVWTENGSQPVGRTMTLWNLLGMTSGLSYPMDQTEWGRAAGALFDENMQKLEAGCGMETVEFCNRMGQLPLAFEPGSQFMYGTSADVLGAVVEVASGKRFGTFLQEELFEPLGMKDTGFYVPQKKQNRVVTTYERHDGILEPLETKHLCVSVPTEAPAFESGGAGLMSTADDYAAFGQMLLNGGAWHGERILKKKTVEFMTQPQLTVSQAAQLSATWQGLTGYSYGKLMRVCVDPGAAVMLSSKGEYGWDGWLGTYFANLPKENMTIILMNNRLQNSEQLGTIRRIRNLVLSTVC